jgi:predicted amidophosphoribosyltransferase
MASLKSSDLRAWVLKRFDFTVFSLGPWTPLGERRFTPLGQLLHNLKYEQMEDASRLSDVGHLVQLALPEMAKIWPNRPAEICTPIPSNLPKSPEIPRRFCEQLAAATSIVVEPELLHKIRPVPSVKRLAESEKVKALSGAYRANPPSDPEVPLLIIDDVFQTGATLREAHKALSQAGYRGSLNYLVLAHIEKPFSGWEELR